MPQKNSYLEMCYILVCKHIEWSVRRVRIAVFFIEIGLNISHQCSLVPAGILGATRKQRGFAASSIEFGPVFGHLLMEHASVLCTGYLG